MGKNLRDVWFERRSKKQGKILKLKLGYNPNSSSIGTGVKIFLWGFVAVTTVVSMVSALITLKNLRRKNPSTPLRTGPDPALRDGGPAVSVKRDQ